MEGNRYRRDESRSDREEKHGGRLRMRTISLESCLCRTESIRGPGSPTPRTPKG